MFMETNQPSGSQERRASDYLSSVPDLINVQQYDRALKQIDQALAVQPGNPKALEYKKQILGLKGRRRGSSSTSEPTGDEKQDLQTRKREKLRELEEERRKLETIRREFEELQRKEEELQRKEEVERNRRIEEQKRLDEQRRREAEQRRKQEELARKQEEEEHRKREEERKKQEELRKIEEEQKRQEEQRKKKQEEERRQKIENLQSQIEELKAKEEQKSAMEEEAQKKQQEEQERARQEHQRREEQERLRKENRRKQEEQERKRQEGLKHEEEELRKKEMEHVIMMDPMRRLETEARLAKEKKGRILSEITTAESLFSAGNLEEAWVEVTRILEADSSFPRALTLRLRIKQAQDKQKKPEESVKNETADRQPEPVPRAKPEIVKKKKNPKVLTWVGVAVLCVIAVSMILVFGRKGTTAVGVQNKSAGSQETGKLVAESTGASNGQPSTPQPMVTADGHVARASMYARQRLYRSALQEYDSAIALAPPIREVFAAKADIDLMVGEYSDAIKMLSHAIDLAPQDTSVLMSVAMAHQLNGATVDGFKYHELVMSLIKDSTRYLTGPIADAIMCNKSLLPRYRDQVLNAFDRSLGAHPNDYDNRYRYARLLMVLGRTKEANVLFQKNRDMLIEEFRNHPDDGRIMIKLAMVMAQLGHFSEAEGFANDAKDFSKAYPEILYKIAELYAVQMQLSKGKGQNIQLKKKALQALHDAVSLHFMLGELTNADLCSLFSSQEFLAAIQVSKH